MPFQIINSGVNLAREPKDTLSVVVFRDQYESVSRTVSNKPCTALRASQQQQRRGYCANAVGGAWGGSKGRKPTLFGSRAVMGVVDGGLPGDGRTTASQCDMTSVFGLEVRRVKLETPPADEHNFKRGRGSTMPTSRPGSCGDDPLRRGDDGLLSPGLTNTGKDTKGGSDSPSEVLLARFGGGSLRPSPVHATLNERINQGNQLVKSVRAGRSLREATSSSMKGALELGLWAVSQPQELARIKLGGSVPNGAADVDKALIAAGLKKNTSYTYRVSRPHASAPDDYDNDDLDAEGRDTCEGGDGDEDPVKMLENKLQALQDQNQARRARLTSLSRMTATASSKGGSDRGRVVTTKVARASGTPVGSNRESGNYGCGRGSESPKRLPTNTRPWQRDIQDRSGRPRGSHGRKQDKQRAGAKDVARTARISPYLADAKMKSATFWEGKKLLPREPSQTSSCMPGNGGKKHTTLPRMPQGLGHRSHPRSNKAVAHAAFGSVSAGRPSPRLPALTSAQEAKQDLIAAVRTFFLRAIALDDELTEDLRRKDFDWGVNTQRMIAAVSVADAGKSSLGRIPQVMRKQALAKQRSDEKKFLHNSWLPSIMNKTRTALGKEAAGAGVPVCMVKLAAALRKVIINGHTITPPLFWSLVDTAFRDEDHRSKTAQKMVLACLASVRQRPEDYHRFLIDSSIAVPTSLRRTFAKALGRQRRALSGKRGGGGQTRSSAVIESSSRPIIEGDLAGDPNGKGVGSSRWGVVSRGDASDDLSDDLSETMSANSCASREMGAMTR